MRPSNLAAIGVAALVTLSSRTPGAEAFLGGRTAGGRQTSRLQAASGYKLGAKTTGTLLNNRFVVETLEKALPDGVEMSEVALLRFALAFPEPGAAERALKSAVSWRRGAGKHIVDAAAEAVAKATANGGWDNDVVRDSAPHAAIINKYIGPKSVMTLSTDEGDLVYVQFDGYLYSLHLYHCIYNYLHMKLIILLIICSINLGT